MKCVWVVMIAVLIPARIALNHRPRFWIWNVGQGQWLTYSTATHCLHFDIGGERADWPALESECRAKTNEVFLSHGDWDHIGFLKTARRRLPRLCLRSQPRERLTPSKARLIHAMPPCQSAPSMDVFEVPTSFKPAAAANTASRVYVVARSILIPGDSPAFQERMWRQSLPHPELIRVLILGHHGSRSSTSPELLRALPGLRLTVASSRVARYGHPHKDVRRKVQTFRRALLTTEMWGHIVISITP